MIDAVMKVEACRTRLEAAVNSFRAAQLDGSAAEITATKFDCHERLDALCDAIADQAGEIRDQIRRMK